MGTASERTCAISALEALGSSCASLIHASSSSPFSMIQSTALATSLPTCRNTRAGATSSFQAPGGRRRRKWFKIKINNQTSDSCIVLADPDRFQRHLELILRQRCQRCLSTRRERVGRRRAISHGQTAAQSAKSRQSFVSLKRMAGLLSPLCCSCARVLEVSRFARFACAGEASNTQVRAFGPLIPKSELFNTQVRAFGSSSCAFSIL